MNKWKATLASVLFIIIPSITLSVHVLPILGFQQAQEVHGLIVDIPRAKYRVGEGVDITIVLVNNQSVTIVVSKATTDIRIAGPHGEVFTVGINPFVTSFHTVEPGGRFIVTGWNWNQRGIDPFTQVPPGQYTITAVMHGYGRWGSTTILILPF